MCLAFICSLTLVLFLGFVEYRWIVYTVVSLGMFSCETNTNTYTHLI